MIYVVSWFLIAFAAGVLGGILAALKNRDYSAWAAWCFLFPPFLIVLLITPKYMGPPPAPRRLGDDGDAERF